MNIDSRPGLLRNLQIGFGLSLLILIITSVASYSSISNLLDGSRWVDHTDSVVLKLDNTLGAIRDADAAARGYLLTADTISLMTFGTARDRVPVIIDSIELMTSDNPVQAQNIKNLREVVFQPLAILQNVI